MAPTRLFFRAGGKILCRAVAAILLASVVAACAPASVTPPVAPPRLFTPPYALPTIQTWAEAYVAETGEALPFDLEPETLEASLARAETERGSVLFFLGPPPEGWFVTPVASLPVTFVIHPDNPVTDLRPRDLENLFTRRTADWETLGGSRTDVQPALPLPGEPVRAWFETAVLRGSPAWPGAWLAPQPEAMFSLIESEEGAVGFVLGADVPDTVRVARVSGRIPSIDAESGGYPYMVDLLAFAPEEPSGGLRDFLVWLQAREAVARGQWSVVSRQP